jgi:hypothetical protein
MVLSLENNLAGPDIPGEEFLAKVGRLRNGCRRAEEMGLAELLRPDARAPSTWSHQRASVRRDLR